MQSRIIDEKEEVVQGYCNRCYDGKYIIFLDYDNLELSWIKPEIKRLQEDFKLSDFYLFRSSEKGVHAVCMDKVSLPKLVRILKNTSIDEKYIQVPLNFGKKIWTLRLSDKGGRSVEYLGSIMSDNYHKEKSLAHIKVLGKIFKGIEFDITNNDGEERLIFSTYKI